MIRGLAEPFGISPECFDPYRLLWRGDHVYALREEAASACHAFQCVSAGLPLAKVSGSGAPRFASRGVQVFGRWATRRVCDLDDGVLSAIVQGQSLPWEAEEGPVILRWLGRRFLGERGIDASCGSPSYPMTQLPAPREARRQVIHPHRREPAPQLNTRLFPSPAPISL